MEACAPSLTVSIQALGTELAEYVFRIASKRCVVWCFPAEFQKGIAAPMAREMLVLDANEESSRQLCALLRGRDFEAKPVYSLEDFEICAQKGDFTAVLMDLDSVAVDNKIIRQLTLRYPGIHFLATSKERFHPELKDAICYHIYACINKPIDEEELFYWLKAIFENEQDCAESVKGRATNQV